MAPDLRDGAVRVDLQQDDARRRPRHHLITERIAEPLACDEHAIIGVRHRDDAPTVCEAGELDGLCALRQLADHSSLLLPND